MRKILLVGCIMLFVFCAPKKTAVQTEGLEEVIVFGEEESNISNEPILPQPTEEEVVAPPVEEEVIAPPISEETITTPPVEEEVIAPPVIEEETATVPPAPETETPVLPPPVVEEEVAAPPAPMEEVAAPPPLPPVVEEEPAVVAEAPPAVEEPYVAPTVTPTPPPPQPAPARVLGFRVQIFASSTEKNASKVADDARANFSQNIYVEYVAPYYKVRVGNCLTREEAEVLKKKAQGLGYRGSFVVETMISP